MADHRLPTTHYPLPTIAVRSAAWLALGVLALLLVGPLVRFVSASSGWLGYPYPRSGSEGLVLYETLLVKRGGDIYAPITPERFISGPYPPVYYWLAASLLPGSLPDLTHPGDVASIFRPGRSVSLVATLLAAVLVPLLVIFEGGYRRSKRTTLLAALSGLLGGALLLTLPQVLVWATRFRGDMLMIALTVGGLTCIAVGGSPARGQARRMSPWLVVGALLFALAFFTKQTALAGPLAAAAYLLLRDWRAGLRWCALMALVVILPFALLDLATGHWFYLKMVVYHSLPLSQRTLTRLLHFAFWDDQWPLILLAGGYTLYRLGQLWRAWRLHTAYGVPMLVPLLALASLVTLPSGAVVGADHNHLLMPGLAVCACVGALLAAVLVRVERIRIEKIAPLVAGAVSLLLVLIYLAFTSAPTPWYGPDLTLPNTQQQEQLRKITLNVRQNPGTLFYSDDPGILALASKETPYDDPFTMTALAPQGRWDESAYRNMLRQGKFSLLVLSCDVNASPNTCRADTFTPGILEAIREGYRVLFRDVLFTYVPK